MAEKKPQGIPVSKVKRAAKIIGTGAKVGGNYVKYYTKKAFDSSVTKESLHQDNAADIYNTLSELKGSALKVAQMMSMDENVLPKAYQDQFVNAQYNAPPLSYPLIAKTFRAQLGKAPLEVFDSFSKEAVHAASIGQVHQAVLGDKKLAVKVQYPGVADAISSDLRLIKPLAAKLLNMKGQDMDMYLEEVKSKLIEETDYLLELKRAQLISEKCSQLNGLRFPTYYPELSAERILTMDWMDGKLLKEYLSDDPSQQQRDQVAQYMWDFFLFQMKELRLVHADPHPGNFMVLATGELGVLDFGCVKEIPEHFARNYFKLLSPNITKDANQLEEIYQNIEFFRPDDKPEEKEVLRQVYAQMIELLAKPFQSPEFDFGDTSYFQQIFHMGDEFSRNKTLRKMNNARGSRDAIYVMRTFFGLYNMLHQLKAKVTLNYPLYELD